MEYLKPPVFTSQTPEQRIKDLEKYIFDLHRVLNYTISELEKIIAEKENK